MAFDNEGQVSGGLWAPPCPAPGMSPGQEPWPPPWGAPVPVPAPRPSRSGLWAGVACAVAGVVVASALAVVGLALPDDTSYPARWDSRVAELAEFVEAERGLTFKHPVHVDFLAEDDFVERVTTDEADLTLEERQEFEDFEAAARALGLAGADTDLFAAGNTLSGEGILAYYDSETERVTVRGTEMGVGLRITLVHELVHALQDQHFDLSRRGSFPTDAQNSAFDAVVEGDATSIENFYYWSLAEGEQESYDTEWADQWAAAEAATSEVPSWLAAATHAPYALGEPFVTALVAARGPGAVDEALRHPPASEEQLMDAARFLAGDEPRTVKAPKARRGDRVIDEADFGTLSWLFMLAERIPAAEALVAVDGWGGDAYITYERAGKVCARSAFVGDVPADTDEMAAALRRWAEGMPAGVASVTRSGDQVELASCDPGPGATAAVSSTGGGQGAEAAMALLVTRAQSFASALDAGATTDQARCVAGAMLGEFTPAELAGDDLPADFEGRSARLRERCGA